MRGEGSQATSLSSHISGSELTNAQKTGVKHDLGCRIVDDGGKWTVGTTYARDSQYLRDVCVGHYNDAQKTVNIRDVPWNCTTR